MNIDKVMKLIDKAKSDDTILVDVIKNVKTNRLITVVTDYKNDNRVRIIEDPKKEPVITEEKIINKKKCKEKIDKRRKKEIEQ